MRIGDNEMAALVRAKHEAGQDLFLVPDRPFSPADAAALSQALGENLLVFLPGDYYPDERQPARCFSFAEAYGSSRFTFPQAPFVCYADIRLAGDDAFFAAMRAAGVYEWILPFADCADPAEHGYRRSYAYLAERRAESRRFIGITALFDDAPDQTRFQKLFGGNAYTAVGLQTNRRIRAEQTETDAERLRQLLRGCAMQPERSAAVLFPTRRQAEEFARLALRLQPCGLVHGGFSHRQNAETLRRFRAGEYALLAATKHLLPSAPFLEAHSVFYAGLPFSAALYGRCAALLPPGKTPLCVTAASDAELNARLAASCAEALALPKKAFTARRREKQERVLALLAK